MRVAITSIIITAALVAASGDANEGRYEALGEIKGPFGTPGHTIPGHGSACQCCALKSKYGVVPGSHWGTLTISMSDEKKKTFWRKNKCGSHVKQCPCPKYGFDHSGKMLAAGKASDGKYYVTGFYGIARRCEQCVTAPASKSTYYPFFECTTGYLGSGGTRAVIHGDVFPAGDTAVEECVALHKAGKKESPKLPIPGWSLTTRRYGTRYYLVKTGSYGAPAGPLDATDCGYKYETKNIINENMKAAIRGIRHCEMTFGSYVTTPNRVGSTSPQTNKFSTKCRLFKYFDCRKLKDGKDKNGKDKFKTSCINQKHATCVRACGPATPGLQQWNKCSEKSCPQSLFDNVASTKCRDDCKFTVNGMKIDGAMLCGDAIAGL